MTIATERQAIIKFASDTKHRKQWFTGISFSHPAKMALPLQLWLIENFTKEGETILDPMAGSGTLLVACSMGRNVICVELEQKFTDMMEGNWVKIQQRGCQLGYSMGKAIILQGDARNLTGILADKVLFSPPFASEQISPGGNHTKTYYKKYGYATNYDRGNNIGNLPYGSIDAVVSSPPYTDMSIGGGLNTKPPREGENDQTGRSLSPSQLGAGKYDKIITSPPYEATSKASSHNQHLSQRTDKTAKMLAEQRPYSFEKSGAGSILKGYSASNNNIGNLKSASYLEAMLQVYQQCYQVLKNGGLMILVTKNFIRNKKQVRLDLDTIGLCEQAGFAFQDRWYRELASQSFWRTIYYKKFPDVEPIKYEDVLVFGK